MTTTELPNSYREYKLDDFQRQAIGELLAGNSVLVSAPTGVGKTLIADYLIDDAIQKNERVIYTAPIKALSNQKYKEFKSLYGADRVGIVTGDVVINSEAQICLMTTEIFRNMLQQDQERLSDVSHIVFDEIHYLADEDRGTVWEESIIFMPEKMRILGLSATIPNVQELADWIQKIKQHRVAVIIKKERAVPLANFVYEKHLGATTLDRVLQYRRKVEENAELNTRNKREWETNHLDLVKHVAKEQGLPCLYFVFSRKMCEVKANDLAYHKNFLTTEEMRRSEEICEKLIADYGLEKLQTVQTAKSLLCRGIGFHHAGLLPGLKEIIETLFAQGLIKVMYATETFAVGINYPVKTVCFDSPSKFDGIGFRPMRNLEYFQMAGRAGRRGLDEKGTVYILASLTNLRPDEFPSTDSGEIEELKSRFNLSYNSVLNLNRNHDSGEIGQILNKNFATYQALNDKKHFEVQLKRETAMLTRLSDTLCLNKDQESCPLIYNRIHQQMRKKQRRLRFIKGRARAAIAAEIREIQAMLALIEPEKCSPKKQAECERKLQKWSELTNQVASLEERTSRIMISGRFNEDLRLKNDILEELDYLKDGKLLPRGEFAAQIYIQELFLSELYFSGFLHELTVDQLNSLLVGIDYEPRKGEFAPRNLPFDIRPIKTIIRTLVYRYGVDEKDARFHPSLCNLAFKWSEGCTFEELLKESGDLQEGDIVQSFRRGIDIMRQMRAACLGDDQAFAGKLRECMDKMDRDLIKVQL